MPNKYGFLWLKYVKFFPFVLGLMLAVSNAGWAASKLIVIAPGETFMHGSGFSGSVDDQVGGISFPLEIASINDTNDNYIDTHANVTYTASTTVSFNPASGTQNLNQTNSGVENSSYSPFITTLTPGVTGDHTVYTGTISPSGIHPGQKSIHVFRMTQFAFNLPGTWNVGDVYYVTVTAQDNVDATVVPFEGTVSFRSPNGGVDGGSTGLLDTVSFTNGVAYPRIQLYYNGSGIYLEAYNVSPDPGTITTSTSSTFTVNAGAATKFVIMGPGQTPREGAAGGDGRYGTVTSQTAGVPFSVSVYATDDYWNRVSSVAAVNLTATDLGGGGSITGPANLSGGVAQFDVDLRRVLAGTQTLTASGGLAGNTDDVPMTHSSHASFGFNTISSPQIAGTAFTLNITAYDAYGNIVTRSGEVANVTLSVDSGGSAFHSTSFSPASINGTEFNGDGNWTGNYYIYRAGFTIKITATSGIISNFTNTFTVNANAASITRYVVVMPGQTYTPGESYSGLWGRDTASPDPQTAGAPFSMDIYVCDGYANQLTGAEGNRTIDLSFAVTDAGAAPTQVISASGLANFSMTLTIATTAQNITASGGGVIIPGTSGAFTVHHHPQLDCFEISAGVGQTAGNAFTTIITARDQYYNPVTNYAGTVYLTCPELDYLAPTESVLWVSTGSINYTDSSLTANWSISGFVAGQLSFSTRIYRAGSGSLFVSDVAADRPSSYTGHIGQRAGINVSVNTYSSMFCIVPGLQLRPGGIGNSSTASFMGDGYEGMPLSQQKDTAFSVTVYAVDAYWNHYTGANDQFTTTTAPSSSGIHNQNYSLVGGLKQLDVSLTIDASYTITIDCLTQGVHTYLTPYTIFSFALDHFDILPNPVPQLWTAGIPNWVTITAYEDGSAVATTFNGNAEIKSTLDHNDTLRAISPIAVTFTAGIWAGDITLYRANVFVTENNNFSVVFGSLVNASSSFKVVPALPDRLLIVESGGMDYYPGISPDIDPADEFGVQGQPAIQEAGQAITKIEFFLCDEYWNKVTETAAPYDADGAITIECSDGNPYPAELGAQDFSGGSVNVNLSTGVYTASNTFILYNVYGEAGQSIKMTKASGETPYELGVNKNRVPIKHAEPGMGFTMYMDDLSWTAGIPQSITVTAIDAYGNTLDSINGASPMSTYKSVDLSVNTDVGSKSLWPVKLGTLEATKWQGGVSYPWIYCYKKATGGGQFITATTDFGGGSRSGSSLNFLVAENSYARLVPVITGMDTPDTPGAGGTYIDPYGTNYPSSPPPASASVFNNFGTPSAQTAGVNVNLQAYSCDIYGNMVKYPDVDVSMSSTDRFAYNPPNRAVVPADGFADFGGLFAFHTRDNVSPTTTITVADATVTTTTAGTTPYITVNPNVYFGLQVLVPGLTAVEGSGNTNVTNIDPVFPGGWYSGVTATDPAFARNAYNGSAQFSGAYFVVTVQAADLFGNFVPGAANDTIRLNSDDSNNNSEPYTSSYLESVLSGGRAWFNCQQRSEGLRSLKPMTFPNSSICDGDFPDYSWGVVQVVLGTATKFAVLVEGLAFEDNTPVYVEAYPNTFTMRVEIRYTATGEIVATAQSFVMEPMLNLSSPPSPASGTLGKNTGGTLYGYANIQNQTYTQAENIYIRVRDAAGSEDPDMAFSPEIRIQASAPTRIEMRADTISYEQAGVTYYQIEANKNARVYADVYDANNNPVSGKAISMVILDQQLTSSTMEAPESLTTSALGTAYATFYSGAQNLQHVIQASIGEVTGELIMFVTVTSDGGVYPNPFNPLRGESAHIDYPLEADAPVKVMIYTLMGDLVWQTEFPAGDPRGGHAGVNSILWDGKNDNGVTIANGGYICVIKANDQEKYRFKIGVYKEK